MTRVTDPMSGDDSSSPRPQRIAYIDATAGIAGDMLLAALIEAGADLQRIQHVIDAVIPQSVRLSTERVDRASQSALHLNVDVLVEDPPHRTWASIRSALDRVRADGSVSATTADLALATFSRLAEAEGAAHGIEPSEVHFHEVGALDSIADVVGACEAWRQLGIDYAVGSVAAVGSGRIRAAHGDIPVPVPAVARLAVGWPTTAGDLLPGIAHTHHHHHDEEHGHDHGHSHVQDHRAGGPHTADHAHSGSGHHHHAHTQPANARGIGELATPTGMALLRTFTDAPGAQPTMITTAIGIGAGTKNTPGRPNVVRVLVGSAVASGETPVQVSELQANVDDLDPRLWPGAIERLLDAGAVDAWLTPIIMKHGRPAHTVHALVPVDQETEIAEVMMRTTGTLGVRWDRRERVVRHREFTTLTLDGHAISVKIARDTQGAIVGAEPEFRDVARYAAAQGLTEREALLKIRRQITPSDLDTL